MVQQLYKDQPSLDLIEILNVASKDGGESSLNILLEEVLAVSTVEDTAVIGDESIRISGS